MEFRVGVVLPPDFDNEPDKKYGLVVDIGGFGTRYTSAAFHRPDPRFVQIVPDGAGPFGDPYQVDSANNGPYGAALTNEVIPYIEKTFRCFGTPKSRFTTGASTGGWVSLALQVFYPGLLQRLLVAVSRLGDIRTLRAWRTSTMSRTFIATASATTGPARARSTATRFRRSATSASSNVCWVAAAGGSSSGRDWASWNAVYGPKGKDGLPVPLWNGQTGAIDKNVVDHWKKYDLKLVLEKNWKELGPKLAGKVHIWVGDADDYFLNAAVRRLKDSTERLRNPNSTERS